MLFTATVLAAPEKGLTEAQCVALKNVHINADAIGLPTRGARVTTVAMAGHPGNQHCKIEGQIRPVDLNAPDINFQLYLPLDWNGKALQLGGSGFDGAIKDADRCELAHKSLVCLKIGGAKQNIDFGF